MILSAGDLDYQALNRRIKEEKGDVRIEDCCGQRFLGVARKTGRLHIKGTPGNALGAYLDGAFIEVEGNVQDAVGDTMNQGRIVVHGDSGDALGYAMRGGSIFVRGNAGYRTGIHMKEYKDKKPVIVVGGRTGSFLGEYLAGGLIVVLGIGCEDAPIGNFTGTGMHGGRIFIRTDKELHGLPEQVTAQTADEDEWEEIRPYVEEFASYFQMDAKRLLGGDFQRLKPNAKNPYKQLYTAN